MIFLSACDNITLLSEKLNRVQVILEHFLFRFPQVLDGRRRRDAQLRGKVLGRRPAGRVEVPDLDGGGQRGGLPVCQPFPGPKASELRM